MVCLEEKIEKVWAHVPLNFRLYLNRVDVRHRFRLEEVSNMCDSGILVDLPPCAPCDPGRHRDTPRWSGVIAPVPCAFVVP